MIDPTGRLKDPVRPVDMNYVTSLETLEVARHPMPGSWESVSDVDQRLSKAIPMLAGAISIGPKSTRKINHYETLARLRHRPSGVMFIVFAQTMDLLLKEQNNIVKYPEWLMKDPVKKTELKIHIYQALRKPKNEDDDTWLIPLPDTPAGDQIHDAVSYYLRTKQIIPEAMYGRA